MKLVFEKNKVSMLKTLKKGFLVPKNFTRMPFSELVKELLGEKYQLSIVLVGLKKIRSLNFIHRGIDKPTDILSFSLENNLGEIFICPQKAKVKSKNFNMNLENYLKYLVIHGLLHLKGMEHSSKMEQYEFEIYSRYRHRHV